MSSEPFKPLDHTMAEVADYLAAKQPTPGAGEGERWHTERMYGGQDVVLWAILTASGDVVGSALKEADADLIVKLHNEREADQQTIADLRGQIDRFDGTCSVCGEKTWLDFGRAADELKTGARCLYCREVFCWRHAHEHFEKESDHGQGLVVLADRIIALEQTIAELRKALENIAATDHEDMNAGYTAWVLSTDALAAIAATGEGKSS